MDEARPFLVHFSRVAAVGDALRLVEAVEILDDLEPSVASSGASIFLLVFEKPERGPEMEPTVLRDDS